MSHRPATPTPQSTPPPAPAPPTPRYATPTDLVAAMTARQRSDQAGKVHMHTGGTGPGAVSIDVDGAFRYGDAGAALRYDERIQDGAAGIGDMELSVIMLPDQDRAWLRPTRMPGSAPLPPGKTWLELTPGSTNPLATGHLDTAASRRREVDPARQLTRLGDAVTLLGSADDPVAGVPARRYALVVDWARAAAREPDPVLKADMRRRAKDGPETQLLWLDAQDRTLRRLTPEVDLTFRDWSTPVDIAPPPTDQIAPG